MKRPRNTKEWILRKFYVGLTIDEERFRDLVTKSSRCKIALIYPNSYSVAIANLGYNRVFEIFTNSGICVERFVIEKEHLPIFSIDEGRRLDEFRIWAFSVHFELDLLNVATLLGVYNIPLRPEERSGYHPLLICGGALTYFMGKALTGIFDAVYCGDFEVGAEQFIATLKESEGKEEILDGLSEVPGIATFGRNAQALPVIFHGEDMFAESMFVSKKGAFGRRFLLEVGRGCKRRCRFCVAGHTMGKARFMDVGEVKRRLSRVKNRTRSVGLISATITDHPQLEELMEYLDEEEFDVSVSSMRLDGLTHRLLKVLAKTQKTFTIAPEGGTQKIRNCLGKGITEKHIVEAFKLGHDVGFKNIKLYFIYGVPGETEEDLKGIVDLVKEARKFFGKVHVSVNPLIPKPGTPFEGTKMMDRKELRERERYLKAGLRSSGVKVDFESVSDAVKQHELCNANRESIVHMLAERSANTIIHM